MVWLEPSPEHTAAAASAVWSSCVRLTQKAETQRRSQSFSGGFSAQITKALPHLFCNKHVKSTLIQTPAALNFKMPGDLFRGLGPLSTSNTQGAEAPDKLRGQSTSLIVWSKSLPKATEQKQRDYPLLERKWNSSDEALKQVSRWTTGAAVWERKGNMTDALLSSNKSKKHSTFNETKHLLAAARGSNTNTKYNLWDLCPHTQILLIIFLHWINWGNFFLSSDLFH